MRSTIWRCLRIAGTKYKSVAMSPLGDIKPLGYPPAAAARFLMSTVADFLEQENSKIEHVNFVIYPQRDGMFFNVSFINLFTSILMFLMF